MLVNVESEMEQLGTNMTEGAPKQRIAAHCALQTSPTEVQSIVKMRGLASVPAPGAGLSRCSSSLNSDTGSERTEVN